MIYEVRYLIENQVSKKFDKFETIQKLKESEFDKSFLSNLKLNEVLHELTIEVFEKLKAKDKIFSFREKRWEEIEYYSKQRVLDYCDNGEPCRDDYVNQLLDVVWLACRASEIKEKIREIIKDFKNEYLKQNEPTQDYDDLDDFINRFESEVGKDTPDRQSRNIDDDLEL